mmetsp:Transcript_22663/g.22864  ORF Transcript_22663/g.22864 Transcript_22663/m.22864 type:complete len:333 (-) Transcript_22663:77-1075(-)
MEKLEVLEPGESSPLLLPQEVENSVSSKIKKWRVIGGSIATCLILATIAGVFFSAGWNVNVTEVSRLNEESPRNIAAKSYGIDDPHPLCDVVNGMNLPPPYYCYHGRPYGKEFSHCQWPGVYCNKKNDIIELYISNQPQSTPGTISSSIGKLTTLQALYLSYNHLTGVLPNEIGQLEKLEVIYLFNNHLKGALPDSLGNLQHLNEFYLSYNSFSGVVPSSLCDLQNLEYIYASFNKFSCYSDCLSTLVKQFRAFFHPQKACSEVNPIELPTGHPTAMPVITKNAAEAVTKKPKNKRKKGKKGKKRKGKKNKKRNKKKKPTYVPSATTNTVDN